MVRKAAPKELTVKTENDTYTLKVPTGPLGWKHFRILMEVEAERKNVVREFRKDTREFITETREDPKTGELKDVTIKNPTFGKDVEFELPSPKLDAIMQCAMDKWIEQILPNVIISHEFDEIPWTELLLLFNAVCSNTNIDTTNFRDIQ